MKRILLGTAAVVLAAVPAVIGLWGNASFSQEVPVRVPASGQLVTPAATPSGSATPSAGPDDHGGDVPRDQRTEPGDDRDVQGGVPAPAPSTGVDDHGGDGPRDQRVEPGDDRDASSGGGDSDRSGSSDSGSSGSDSRGGSDDGGSDDGGDDHGGHGSDD